jgi:hypothetical protein
MIVMLDRLEVFLLIRLLVRKNPDLGEASPRPPVEGTGRRPSNSPPYGWLVC